MVEMMKTKESQVLNVERVQALETWLSRTNTRLTQVNGQRKYGGPPDAWDGPVPGPHCEVFISQIPRDTYEDALIPLFGSVGPLWEFRLMMNFSGQNRGFAYAKYGASGVAADAVRLLHGHVLEPGVRLSVCRSTEKRHICIKNLPGSTRQDDLLKVLRALADGVERVSLRAGPGRDGVSAVVAFSSHHSASMAKKTLVEAFMKQFALSVSVKWNSMAKPSADEPPPPWKSSKSLVASPPPPPRAQSSAQPAAPPPLAPHPSTPPGFSRAAGGTSCSQGRPAASPATLLEGVCEATGVGRPLYEIRFSHPGPDGFLHFAYAVRIPAITVSFKGLVVVLPGAGADATLEEARQAAAQQVLQKVYQLSCR